MGPQVWSRFEQEDDAYAAFSEYLHLASPRPPILDYARDHKRHADILRWALAWMWEARVTAYDEYTAQAPMRRFYPVSHPIILALLRMCVAEMKKFEEAQRLSGEAPGFFTMAECLKMMREVRAAERDIARLEKEQKEAQAEGALVHDFSRLTLEEHRMFDNLLNKVMTK